MLPAAGADREAARRRDGAFRAGVRTRAGGGTVGDVGMPVVGARVVPEAGGRSRASSGHSDLAAVAASFEDAAPGGVGEDTVAVGPRARGDLQSRDLVAPALQYERRWGGPGK